MPGVRSAPSAHDAHRRGRALETVVADLFRARGYAVEVNVIRRGRSGARHELDVLAVRDDGLVSATVAVECKNRAAPIDTEVVARARMLRDDLGVSEVLVVAPGGWGPAAGAAAAEGGVTLWGGDELSRHIGRAALDALTGDAPPLPRAPGLARRVPAHQAARALRVHVTGPLGVSRDRLGAVGDAWLPLHELRIAAGGWTGRMRPRLRVGRRHVLYEAVCGTVVGVADDPLATDAVALDAPVLPVRVRAADLEGAVTDAAHRRDAVTQDRARERHRAALADLGVDADAEGVVVEDHRTVHLPVSVAVVTRGATERLVVLDAVAGRVDDALSDALTRRLADVVPCLAPSHPPDTAVR